MSSGKKDLWLSRVGASVAAVNYRGAASSGQLLDVVDGVRGLGGDAVALVLHVRDDRSSDR